MSGTVVEMKRPSGKALEIVSITPEMAMQLLELNTYNRPLSDVHVKRIARQIKEGKWRFNGDTIKIAENNDVLDGQHRLWAIAEAKKPVETVVVRGIKREAFATIDTVRRLRSGSDVLALAGVERNRPVIATALTWLIRWQRDCISTWRDPKNKIENSDVEAAFTAHPRMAYAAERAGKVRSVANPGIIAFIYYILSNRNLELAERFIITLENPAGISINDPFYKLRQYFLLDRDRAKDSIHSIALCFKAINATAQGKKVERLMWNSQGKRAEEFPFLDV